MTCSVLERLCSACQGDAILYFQADKKKNMNFTVQLLKCLSIVQNNDASFQDGAVPYSVVII